MPFELKVLGKINCPRCNAVAEQRVDKHKNDYKLVLVYIVCPTCRLEKYSYTTTRKAILIQQRINQLSRRNNNLPKSRVFRKRNDIIKKLEEEKLRAERDF